MASTVLQITGQVVGSAVGGPVGGFIAGQIGGAIGRNIEGPSRHHYEGARLESLAAQTSTYGRAIPIVFGTVRLAGNVIWSRPIKEVATTTKTSSGGKAGGAAKSSSTSTTYSYYITLAVAICEGEISRIHRVWADSDLLDLSQGTYRIYKGTETQLPDPLIESFQGVGATPAYRGMAYVVIEDFPMGDYGNRIPNFTFEVTRKAPQGDVADTPVESLVKSVMLIPGSGEFVYDTNKVVKTSGAAAGSGIAQSGYQVALNQHTPEGKANVRVALDALQETFPALEWVGVVANWFGTTMDIGTCELWPCVEYQGSTETTPNAWGVAGFTRSSARLIGYESGSPRYGGTPDDDSIVNLLTELRARGLKIFFYPQLLMDIAGKPWRGELTGSSANVSNFFTKTRGYNAFILHYANLVAGKVDAFAIGTEMRDLTKITSSTGVFPAVSQLVSLASSVKTILGTSVKVTYAADWSEYHNTDGGWYHLDPLWASSAIDVVGIDAYFPLTDGVQTNYDIAPLIAGWTSGEGYDWYYTDPARTTKATLSPAYAWKNIEWWWNNTHTNPGGGTTAWVPGSKPIWFTEYGFPSVDGCANQPNVFVDATSAASAYPRFSRGRVDFMAQRTAIAATESKWLGSSMITNKFLWTWDARPYPYWPDLTDVWADGANWATGHWVQGKLGSSHLAGVVEQIAQMAGLSDAQIDTSALQAQVDGFVIAERVTARAAIEQLMQAYFFTLKESARALVAVARTTTIDATVNATDCVEQKAGDQFVPYLLAREEDLVLPQRQEVHFLYRLQRYETHVEAAERGTASATDTNALRLSLVLSESHARHIAELRLADRWAARSKIEFQLPVRNATLEPGDTVSLVDGLLTHRVRLTKVQIGKPGLVRVKGVIDGQYAWDGYIAPSIGSGANAVSPNAPTALAVLDIPAFPGDDKTALTLRVAMAGTQTGWQGATLSRVQASGDSELLLSATQPAIMGAATTVLASGPTNVFDEANSVDVALIGTATLANATDLSLLNGANAAVLGNEVIQFASVTLLSPGIYRLSRLLRGRLGTEAAIGAHAAGERFVLLNEAVVPLTIPAVNYGQSWQVRATSFGDSLSTGTQTSFTIQGNSLKPLSPVDASAIKNSTTGDITLRWKRRTRIDGDLRDAVDVPINEEAELYDVVIYNGASAARSWQVTSPMIIYSAAQQTTDFGSSPTSLSLDIRQRSALVGAGNPLITTVVVQ